MDHQAFLGNTLSEIAEKKAGIIKPGCSVVTVGQQPETMAVIERVCRENGADLTEADLHEAKAVKEDFAGQTLEYRGENYEATEVVEKSYLTTRYWLCSFVGCSPIQVPPNKSSNCVAMLRS